VQRFLLKIVCGSKEMTYKQFLVLSQLKFIRVMLFHRGQILWSAQKGVIGKAAAIAVGINCVADCAGYSPVHIRTMAAIFAVWFNTAAE
jgi:hypothetical protein